MALPNTITPATPLGTDSPAQGDDELRGIKQYLVDVLGVPNAVSVTAAAMAVTSGGLVTISQSPLTVPTEITGGASQFLQLTAGYSSMHFVVGGTQLLTLSQTGMLLRQPFFEFPSGMTGRIGTQSTNPLYLQTQGQPRWLVDQSGMLLGSIDNAVDIGALGAQRPRNLYVASNLIVGGQIMTGPSNIIITDIGGGLAAIGPPWWQMNSSGMLLATTDAIVDIGRPGAQRPRNMYLSGIIEAGSGAVDITTTAGLLDLTKGVVSGEVQGDVLIRGASSWDRLAAGSIGFFLQTQGAGANPQWVSGAGGVTQGQNPVAWTGGHSWSAPTFLLTSGSALVGIGTSTPTAMLHVAGSVYVASNLILAGVPNSTPGSILDRNTSTILADNTGVETTLYTFTVPAAILSTNRRLRLTLMGYWSLAVNNATVYTFRLKYGATTVATMAGQGDGTENAFTAAGMAIQATISATAATNTQQGQLVGWFDQGGVANRAKVLPMLSARGTSTIDDTVAQTLSVTVQWTTGIAGNTVAVEHAVLELL